MLWVEIEVNFSDPKHMVDPTWCVDEVDNTSAAGFHDIWWFWCHLQTRHIGLDRRVVIANPTAVAAAAPLNAVRAPPTKAMGRPRTEFPARGSHIGHSH